MVEDVELSEDRMAVVMISESICDKSDRLETAEAVDAAELLVLDDEGCCCCCCCIAAFIN